MYFDCFRLQSPRFDGPLSRPFLLRYLLALFQTPIPFLFPKLLAPITSGVKRADKICHSAGAPLN